MSVQNYKICKQAFFNWMKENYDIEVENVASIDFDQEMYKSMKSVANDFDIDESDIASYNNIALNRVQKLYTDQLRLVRTRVPSVKPLDRDTQAFGNRPVTLNSQAQGTRTTTHDNVISSFDALMNIRREDKPEVGNMPIPFEQQVETKIDVNEFAEKMKQLAQAREDDYLQQNIQIQGMVPPQEESRLYPQTPQLATTTNTSSSHQSHVSHVSHQSQLQTPQDVYVNRAQEEIIPKPTTIETTSAYLTINGFDRNVNLYKYRYNFSISVTDFMRSYKNINSIEFTRLILPMEIEEVRSINNPVLKYSYTHEQKFAFPYILLQVQELTNVYDGLNEQVRKSATQFIYDRSYKCPNGRGYIILKPAQKEKRRLPQPLSSLQRLSFAVAKPNGALFNTSEDSLKIIKVEYESYNDFPLKIITDRYFDKNEFYQGDTIMMKNVQFTPSASWQPSLCVQSTSEYTRLNDFLNRSEGHDVVRLGTANENGFYRSFYINAPLYLDSTIGKMIVDKALVDVVREYNVAFPVNMNDPTTNGNVINISLQPTISFKMTTETYVPMSVPL